MKRAGVLNTAVLGTLVLLLAGPPPLADTLLVPSTYTTIQAAINAATNGDQIEVAPGEYYEAINFSGKAIRLYSSGGNSVTTINGTGHYHVVQCVNGESSSTILEGFTITGRNASGTEPNDLCGGGMFNFSSNPTLTNCFFAGNSAMDSGGGTYNYNSSPTVTNCGFSYNNTSIQGGGMYNSSSDPAIYRINAVNVLKNDIH